MPTVAEYADRHIDDKPLQSALLKRIYLQLPEGQRWPFLNCLRDDIADELVRLTSERRPASRASD